jgi:hypothetical protein
MLASFAKLLQLAQDDPGLYLAGIKSYGRAPTFLMITGYEQVRSIAADIAGDRPSASNWKLAQDDPGLYLAGIKSYGRSADLPHDHRLRTGPVDRGRHRRRSRIRRARRTGASGDRRLHAVARSKAVTPLQNAAAVLPLPASTPVACRTPRPRPSERPAAGAPEVMPGRQVRAVLSLGTTQTLAWVPGHVQTERGGGD